MKKTAKADIVAKKGWYLFIRADEGEAITKLTNSLDDFKEFCHYSSLSNWKSHKRHILKCLDSSGIYVFDGNDVHYYIIQHPMWEGEFCPVDIVKFTAV